MLEVLEIDSLDELAHYRMLWNSLFAATPGATFFLTIDWLETCWQHFGGKQELRVLVVKSAGQPIGILPLCVRTERRRFGNLRVLTYPLDNWGTWYGPIGPNPSATMLAAMQHLRTRERDWDMMELRWVGPSEADRGATIRAMRASDMLTEKEAYQSTSLVDLPGTWDEFLASKSHHMRRDIRKKLQLTFGNESVEFVRHRPAPATEGDGDPRWDLYAMCEEVAQASWQGTATDGNTITHDRVREYFRDAHQAAARRGMVDICLAKVGGRPAAFLYSYHHDGQITALRTGFDTSLAERSIGYALVLKALEDGVERGDRVFDFGPGDGEHKRRLRTRVETTNQLTYTPIGSWRSQTVRLSRWAKTRWQQRRTVAAAAAMF